MKGLGKFLNVAWKEDPERGEANFDIDSDHLTPATPHFFLEMDKPNKLKEFERELNALILAGTFGSDFEIVRHTLCSGFLPRHARIVVTRLRRTKKIDTLDGLRPRISDRSFNEPRQLKVLS